MPKIRAEIEFDGKEIRIDSIKSGLDASTKLYKKFVDMLDNCNLAIKDKKLSTEDIMHTASKALVMIKENVGKDLDLTKAVITEIQSQINIDVQLNYQNEQNT